MKDWANDEMARVCKISQNLKANTNNDQTNIKINHNEKMDVCQKVKFLEQQLLQTSSSSKMLNTNTIWKLKLNYTLKRRQMHCCSNWCSCSKQQHKVCPYNIENTSKAFDFGATTFLELLCVL